ncbi:unnamed protein product [Amaranthus hypochondriacus]
MEVKAERNRPIAVFMAFGTKGDVYPIAAIAVAFACDQRKYEVVFVSHSAHQDLATHLIESNVRYFSVCSPPVLPPPENNENDKNSIHLSFCSQKRTVLGDHRQECLLVMERIFGYGPTMKGDIILINFFALEGWSLAELFHVQCVVVAPYVINYTAPSSLQRKFRLELPLLYQYLQEAPDGLSSAGNFGFMRNPKGLLCSLEALIEKTNCRFILFTAGFEPLDVAIQVIAAEGDSSSSCQSISLDNGVSLCNNRLYCFSSSLPYSWLFPKCVMVIHHGGSGSTAAALRAGIPQVICPFMLDQFYWAERMCWLGVAPEPLRRNHLLPESCNDVSIREGADILRNALNRAMSPELKARALEISGMNSREDGLSEAVRILKEEVIQ